MPSIIVAMIATLCLEIAACGTMWFIDFRYRRCLQHLDDAGRFQLHAGLTALGKRLAAEPNSSQPGNP